LSSPHPYLGVYGLWSMGMGACHSTEAWWDENTQLWRCAAIDSQTMIKVKQTELELEW